MQRSDISSVEITTIVQAWDTRECRNRLDRLKAIRQQIEGGNEQRLWEDGPAWGDLSLVCMRLDSVQLFSCFCKHRILCIVS